jgi:hypothetical protein
MKKLGLMILIVAGMTILPHKTLADIYTFDFQGTLNQIYNGQTINGLSISSGTFVDVSFSIDSATPGFMAGDSSLYYDSSAITSITLRNSFGMTSVSGTYGTQFEVIDIGDGTEVELVSYESNAALGQIRDWQLNIYGTSDNTLTLASGIQMLENNPLTDTILDLWVTDLGWNVISTSEGNVSSMNYTVTPVPEPSTFAFGALGIASLLAFRRSQFRR